jgi:hypothetical protein
VKAGQTESPYWPGGALLLQDDRTPQVLRLLEDVPLEQLLPPAPEPDAVGEGDDPREDAVDAGADPATDAAG